MGNLDRNAANSERLRRNAQRTRSGNITSSILVTAPIVNTGTRLQLTLLSTGGLTTSSSSLTIKLIDTSLVLSASGVGVNLRTSSGLQISTGLGILVDAAGSGLSLGASGLKYTSPVTTKGDVLTFSTVPARLAVGANNTVLMADSAQTTGNKWAALTTTKGDVLTFDTAPNRLGVGANNTVLTADSAQATGLKWAAPTVYLLSTNFVFNEVPSGTINGVNTAFTLANTPTAGTVRVYKSGLRQVLTTDYSVSGTTITFVVAPAGGSTLIADYLK
jgi:hypothetical protein